MKKILKKFVFIALIFLLSAFALFGCQKKETRLTVDQINGLPSLLEKGTIKKEWVGDFKENAPLLVVFHGETKENEIFSLNIPTSVYTEESTYLSEEFNVNTIGLKGNGLQERNGEYVLTDYWTKIAGFNVLLLHYEPFFAENTADVVTKIYTSYKSRYMENGERKEANFGRSFAEVMACVLYEELDGKELNKSEIRFLGNGTGANLALATAAILYKQYEKDLISDYLPCRVTACDPFLAGEDYNFTCSFLEKDTSDGILSLVAKNAEILSKYNFATELVETEETDGTTAAYAYQENVRKGDEYEKLISCVASLTLKESYSLLPSFENYKEKKRIAFDWYFYSIVGSDDSKEYDSTSQKFAIGYPKKYIDLGHSTLYASNWSYDAIRGDARRPIMNNRRLNNDSSSVASENYGMNFAVGAWTPTPYIFGLKGVSFNQKEGGYDEGKTDIHGNEVFRYQDYILKTFRSENYQYADLNESTIIVGKVYVDENQDGAINDGNKGKKSSVFLTGTKNTGEILFEKTKIETDGYGCFYVVLHDRKENENLGFSVTGNKLDVYGYAATKASEDGVLCVKTELVVPKGYTARFDEETGMKYDLYSKNNAKNGAVTTVLKKFNVHSVLVTNMLLRVDHE